MATLFQDIKKNAKTNIIRGVGKAMFGSGVVGGALGKAFEKKFLGKEEQNSQVEDALAEQTEIQSNNDATLSRIETIVMNIADNIYNIAGIMNAQVVSMEEANRLQQERAFRDAAAQEEANSEALKVAGPSVASQSEKPDKEKQGILGSILGSISSTKAMLGKFIKKFAIVAAGLAVAGGLGYAASSLLSDKDKDKDKDTEDEEDEEDDSSEPPKPMGPLPGGVTPEPTAFDRGPDESDAETKRLASKTPSKTPEAPDQSDAETKRLASKTPVSSEPATQTSSPPPVAAASSSLKSAIAGLDQNKVRQYLQTPIGSVQGAKLHSLSNSMVSLESQPQTKDVVAQKQELVKQQLEIIQTIKSGMETPVAMPVAKATPSAPPPGGSAGGSSGGSAGGSGGSPSPGGGGSASGSDMGPSESGAAATPIATPPPSTGADVGNASMAVSAASEPNAASSSQVINNSSTTGKPSFDLPIVLSPVADRGSLDIGVTFNTRGGGD